jgi:hypothetical protein
MVMVDVLRGRRREREVLDRLLDAVRAGKSRVLVLRGDPGVGKSALLDYLAGRALRCRVARTAGVPAETELEFSGLHQLCAPMLDRLGCLPDPQRDALCTAFGLQKGGAPSRFLVGLAVLGLLAAAAEEQPLVWVVDDAQWLDQASAQTLTFVARRLGAEPVGLVAWHTMMRERYWVRRCSGRWTSGYSTGSSPKPEATRGRFWSCCRN